MSFTHIPSGQAAANVQDSARMARANMAKSKVHQVAEAIKGFDQKPEVDLDPEPDRVTIKEQNAPMTATKIVSAMTVNPFAAIPEKLSGTGHYKDGQVLELDATVKEPLGGDKRVRFQQKDDGVKVYSAPDMLGTIAVREHTDGTLFIATGKDADQVYEAFLSDDFSGGQGGIENLTEGAVGKEGLARYVPDSLGSDLTEVADKTQRAIQQGGRKFGDWLSELNSSIKPSVEPDALSSPEGKPEVPTDNQNEWKPRVTLDNLAEGVKKDPAGLVADSIADVRDVGRGLLKGLFGRS